MYMKTSPKLGNVVLMLTENTLRRMRLRMIAINYLCYLPKPKAEADNTN